MTYHTFHQNLQNVFPSLSSTNRYIRKTHGRMIEGVLRCEELAIYLKERNLPLAVSLSEDATRITGRIQYDRKTNQLVGFVQPINQTNGLPISFSYKARNYEEIIQHFSSGISVSSFVNVIMAQPLSNAPAFCLLLYGTDSKYTSVDVLNRWKTTTNKLRSFNIKIVSISSDSDPKYNSVMRQISGLGQNSNLFPAEWFCCRYDSNDDTVPIQDTVHIGTKERNYLLRTSKRLVPFGRHILDVKHLHVLCKMFGKDQHRLTKTVLNPLDKQNFASVQKMCSDEVIHLLERHIKGSDGTVKYLEIMRAVIDSFLDGTLEPLQRIQKIWYATFMLRLWRKQVLTKKGLTLEKHFITMNTYTCIEMNAHGLVQIILNLIKSAEPQLFQTRLFSSQPCEKMFRQIRSFTTVYSTVVNCSVKEILERVNKIQLQSDIVHKLSPTFNFPRLQSQNDIITNVALPTKEQIFQEIENSKQTAIRDAFRLGLISRITDFDLPCEVNVLEAKTKSAIKITRPSSFQHNLINLCLKNYAHKFEEQQINESSGYVEIPIRKSQRMIVKKTSLCWVLREDYYKLSSDRLERVKAPLSGSLTAFKKKVKSKKTEKPNKKIRKPRKKIYNSKMLNKK